jgi:hypothetical protein
MYIPIELFIALGIAGVIIGIIALCVWISDTNYELKSLKEQANLNAKTAGQEIRETKARVYALETGKGRK